MITLRAKINISTNNFNTINSINEEYSMANNISAPIQSVLGKRSGRIGNPFILGKSKLGDGSYYANSVPYFMGEYLSDDYGNFQPKVYTIVISGSSISAVTLVFDTENDGHPDSIYDRDEGKFLYVNDSQVEIIFNRTLNEHTIIIPNWNKPNSNFILTGIYTDINIEIDRKNLTSFNSEIVDRTNTQYPSYGIISNSANLNFADFDEQLLSLITKKILHSGIEVSVWLNNTESNKQEQVCSMGIRELSYDNDNRQVQVSLKDNLEEWQDINVSGVGYYLPNGEPIGDKSAKWFYQKLFEETPEKYNMQSFEELDMETQNILENTIIKYPTLEEDNLWNEWQKLCELCLLHIYIDNEGKTVCRYNN